jgi:biotin operon repressor
MSKRWTDKERNYLKENYNLLPMNIIVGQLGRTPTSIRSQIDYLRKRGWTFHRVGDTVIDA